MSLSRDLLEDEDIERLIDACEDSPTGVRDRALISIMVATGVRVSEALAIQLGDLDLDRRRLHVRRGTSCQERIAWVHPDARASVRKWLRHRGDFEGPLFCRRDGLPLTAGLIRKTMKRLRERSGIEKRVYSDGFRHVFAARAYRAGVTTRSLQVQFGHENVAATLAYLERLGLHRGFAEFDRTFGSEISP